LNEKLAMRNEKFSQCAHHFSFLISHFSLTWFMRKSIFPGSFDPPTLGHAEIVLRATALFDEVIVAIGTNSAKSSFFTLDERLEMLRLIFAGHPNVVVTSYEGLTVDFAHETGAKFLLRGLRTGQDLDYERPIALINRHMDESLETVFLITSGAHSHISSTLVREVIRYGRDASGLVPDEILPGIHAKQAASK
jgi:pantetheine-phosphate adenylyltransferase